MAGVEFAAKVVVVTGAAGGIGSATAHRFAEEGGFVVVTDRDAAGAEAVVDAITAEGGTAVACVADLRTDEGAEHIVTQAIERFGRIDVVHNNAGYFPAPEGRLHETTAATRKQWDLTVDINLRASTALSAAAIAHMIPGGGGTIVNTSSAQGRAGDVAWASYGIAKAGVESLTRYLATQYGRDNIRCNCVAPGLTATPNALARLPEDTAAAIRGQTPLGRMGRPDEVAEAVLFLASERSSFITGQVLAVDGGMLSHMPPTELLPVTTPG